MFRKPLVVGVRQVEPAKGMTVEQTMLSLGQNTGNMMFTQSLLSFIKGATWGSFALTPEEMEKHDAIVLAAANWVNDFDDFGWLADRLEKTKLPLFLIGVGAQATSSREIPEITKGTLRLLKLVQDRSTSISVRGNFSCEVLQSYGIKSVQSTGCPSLLLVGPQGPQSSLMREANFDACSIHATRHGFRQADSFQTFLYRQALRRDIDIVLQSEVADIHYVMQPVTEERVPGIAAEAVKQVYGTDDIEKISSYLVRHGHVFTKYPDWISYMRRCSFVFGTRIHGTIAALIAGTPATLIAHDSRTIEMAEIMGIPVISWQNVLTDRDIDIATLYSRLQMEAFKNNFDKYYRNFLSYLAENSLLVSEPYQPSEV